jgi:hypothetical protein
MAKNNRKQWFIDRIGKIIFRSETTCKCSVCNSGFNNGILIKNELQANYLYDVECDMTACGHFLNYRDEK